MKLQGPFSLLPLLSCALAHPWLESRAVNHRAENIDTTNPANLVNVFIGTTKGGHTFPGATLPHGMVKVGMDTQVLIYLDSPDSQAGYDANVSYNAIGFSALHDQGTGGGTSLQHFKLWPFPECPSFADCYTSIDGRKTLRKVLRDGSPDDVGSPGYFATNLSTNVRVELTAASKAALHRYTFPSNTTQPRILVDITNDGGRSGTNQIVTINSTTGRVSGGGEFSSSFGPERYKVYGCIDFKGDGYDLGSPTEWGVALGNSAVKGSTSQEQVYYGFTSEMGGLLTFNPNPTGTTSILARVGVSFISVDQACSNAESEIPDWNFDQIRKTSWDAWNELLGRIKVDTTKVDDETAILLYSSLYRTHVVPADYSGENPRWASTGSEPYYDSLYCNWDTYRTMYPLMSLHDPGRFSEIVRGMIDIQRHEGWLPECRGATTRQWIQGGTDADPILGEFLVKFQDQAESLGVSAADLYTALLADAENQSPEWNLAGRQAEIWKSKGYIPSDVWESGGANSKQVSRTLEHAFGDFAISQVAKLLGHADDAAKYVQRAGNFINVWNPNVTATDDPSIKGMMQPRFADGTWNYTDPRHCSPNDPGTDTCFLNAIHTDGFYESSPLVYSQYVPQDTAKLIELQGGNESFIARLDYLFDKHYFDVTDEPSQQIGHMYNYANRPGLTTQRTRQVIAEYFNNSANGLPGNDDSGAMGSFVVFYLAGMYPLPATRQFLLASPYFPEISFFNPIFNTTTTIKAHGFKGNPADGVGGTVYVKNVTIDGQPWKSNCFLEWDAFVKGSTIELELTDDITVTCGDGPDALPPSISTGGYN